ncbi:MAG: DUF493 domain-containing protein [Candidatus Omnitrophica bacterium]|nr:DUF493 domain-containing protein [Candidatus Omnitrophota bacterium]
MEKPDINYPCDWGYKIIGKDERLLRKIAADVINDRDYSIILSRKSKAGNYVSLDIKTKVLDEADRNKIFSDLSSSSAVKIVL